MLRTSSYALLLKKENLKQAILDISTRWSSTYLMLERLYELKMFCDDHQQINNDLKLSSLDWERIENMVLTIYNFIM